MSECAAGGMGRVVFAGLCKSWHKTEQHPTVLADSDSTFSEADIERYLNRVMHAYTFFNNRTER